MLAVTPSGSPKTPVPHHALPLEVTTIPGYRTPRTPSSTPSRWRESPSRCSPDRKGRVIPHLLGLMPKEELTAALDKAIR